MVKDKHVVAQYNETFYLKIQPFIYYYISNLKNFYPIYFARNFLNLDLFPLPKNDLYLVPVHLPKRYTYQWLYYGMLRKFSGINICAEEIVLRKRKVRLIHAHFGPEGFNALKLRGKLNIPLVTSFYGYDVSRLAQQADWRERYQTLFREGNLFLVEGEFMKSRIIELGAPSNKVRIQRIAIPLTEFPYSARKPRKAGDRVIFFFCGRFTEKKGLIFSLRALEKIRGLGKDFEFRIVGDGKLRPEIEIFIKEHGMSECVKLLGSLDHQDYLKEMRKADIYIHPSVTAEDGNTEGGAPTTILEAQGMGIPVLTTYHADIPNIVVPGESALLCNERDWQGLADNINYLMENQDCWEKMGRRGREFVAKYHDIRNELSNLEEKYRSIIE